jgi:MFS family permease
MVTNVSVILLPKISLELGITVSTLNWITIIFFISSISVSIPLSKLISQYGVKKYTKIAICGLILGLLISTFTINTEMFLLSRVIQGINCAILYFSIYMMVIMEIPKEKTGHVLGIVGSAGYVGMTIAPSLAGIISNYLSWRFAFFMIVPLLAFQLFLAHYLTDEWTTEKKQVDNIGSLLYVLFIVFLIYGLSNVVSGGKLFLIVAVALFVIFIIFEKKRTFSIYNLNLLKNFQYVIGNYSASVGYFVTFIATYVLSLHLQVVMKINSAITGLILFITPVLMVFVALYAGKLSDKYDSRIISSIAMVVISGSLIIFALLEYIPFYMIILGVVLQGIGHGLFSSPNNRFVLTSVEVEDLPDASSFLSTVKEMGKLFSTTIFNVICVLFMGRVEISKNVSGLIISSRFMMVVCLIMSLSCIILLCVSKYYFEINENPDVIIVLKKILPAWLIKRFKYDGSN